MQKMEITCYVAQGWEPRIRPASTKRDWMDDAPESYPYRCLPLSIANSHGWDILSPCAFEVVWNGGQGPDDVTVTPAPGTPDHLKPVALFGLGSFTIHVQGLFRTPEGWNLYVSGPPNAAKDGVAPLAGIVETDWSPYTFTMNWRLTRPGQTVRFEENEPIAHIFPVQRGATEAMEPRVVPLSENPELEKAFHDWSRSRDAFQAHVAAHPPSKPADKWQKLYYRGLMPEDGSCPFPHHQNKLRIQPFENAPAIPDAPATAPAPAPEPAKDQSAELQDALWKVAKYEWLLETQQQQRSLSIADRTVFRCEPMAAEDFLEDFYAPGRPVVISGLVEDWPARQKWTPDYLSNRIGSAPIECQGERTSNARFELDKEAHIRRMPFNSFMDVITAQQGNELYLTAYNSDANTQALEPLAKDLGRIDNLLDHSDGKTGGMMWIGPEGTFTPLHHDLTNNLLLQITGRKRVVLLPPSETPKLGNDVHVFSRYSDILDDAANAGRPEVRAFDVTLEPGDALFLPIGWWHQVHALDFSVSMTFTNFLWPNEGWKGHPSRT